MPRYAGAAALEYAKARRKRRAKRARAGDCEFCDFWNPLARTPQATALVRSGRCDLSRRVTEQGDGCENWQYDDLGDLPPVRSTPK